MITHTEVCDALRRVPVGATVTLYGQSVYRPSLRQWSVELSADLSLWCAVDALMARFLPVKGVARVDPVQVPLAALHELAAPPSYHHRRAYQPRSGRCEAAPPAPAPAARPAHDERG